MTVLDDTMAAMTQATTVQASAIVFISGVPGLIQAAIDKATLGGATAAQLAPFTDLAAQLKTESDALQTALTANTPQA